MRQSVLPSDTPRDKGHVVFSPEILGNRPNYGKGMYSVVMGVVFGSGMPSCLSNFFVFPPPFRVPLFMFPLPGPGVRFSNGDSVYVGDFLAFTFDVSVVHVALYSLGFLYVFFGEVVKAICRISCVRHPGIFLRTEDVRYLHVELEIQSDLGCAWWRHRVLPWCL